MNKIQRAITVLVALGVLVASITFNSVAAASSETDYGDMPLPLTSIPTELVH